jgi:hypothetical protein
VITISYEFFIIDHLPKKQVIHKNHQLLSSSTPKIHEELQKTTPKKIMKLATPTQLPSSDSQKRTHTTNTHSIPLSFLHSCTLASFSEGFLLCYPKRLHCSLPPQVERYCTRSELVSGFLDMRKLFR